MSDKNNKIMNINLFTKNNCVLLKIFLPYSFKTMNLEQFLFEILIIKYTVFT